MPEPIKHGEHWSLTAYVAHNEALRSAEERHKAELAEAQRRFDDERDRRYKEVEIEKGKALIIKETAGERALQLQAEAQAYKDAKANELREQISRERGLYVTNDKLDAVESKLENGIRSIAEKFDTAIKPITEFMASQIGKSAGKEQTWSSFQGIMTIGIGLALVILAYLALKH